MTRPKLLLADDSVTIRKAVELTFASEGVDVHAVANGDSAMQKFVEIQPDIVLVDIGMPGPNGYQICEMIKQDEATKHIPVLLLVGSFEPFDQTEAERVGADGFLTKPFHSIRELAGTVLDLLSRDAARQNLSDEMTDIEELYSSSFAETVPLEEDVTEEDLLADSGLDDEMIEASHPTASNGESDEAELIKAIEIAQPVKDFAWSPASTIAKADGLEPTKSDFEPLSAAEDIKSNEIRLAVTADAALTNGDDNVLSGENMAVAELSDELVSLVAKRVIETLSDHIIREIAQEAVPRIAETLIREALDEENKI